LHFDRSVAVSAGIMLVAAKAAQLEAALRRNLSSRQWREITSKPQVRPLVIRPTGTAHHPGRPSYKDLEDNAEVLRSLVEVFPDRVPGAHTIVIGLLSLDKYYEGDALQFPKDDINGDPDNYHLFALGVAYAMKVVAGRLRRLFRRSNISRSAVLNPRVLKQF
jgi:hypothetical protein